jgi:SagB-type dehydrogenase family enzyme
MKFAHPFLFSSLIAVLFSAGSRPVMVHAEGDPLPDPPSGSIKLPQPVHDGNTSLERTLHERRSTRQYKNTPILLSDLSQLLWAAQGISGLGGRRTAPSAGALFPLDVYVVAGNVSGLSAGIYSYDPHKHELSRVAEADARAELNKAALGQLSISAPAVLVLSAVYERTTVKYSERGIRYVHMEAGHVAQNIYLQAAALNLGTVVIGAFDDDGIRTVLHMTGREHPLYLMPVGKK